MAELLQALLQRQRRRNPYADIMGPDPMDSQAYMDSAQGADVSMPAPVGGQPQMDDSGGGGGIVSLAGGSGGSRNPFRMAEAREDDAPMEATVAGRGQRRPKECPGGVCRPRSTVVQGFSSSPRIISDGGYVVSSSPTIVSSAPMASTIVSGPSYSSGGATLGDVQGLYSEAMSQQSMGSPAGRALAERGIGYTLAQQAEARAADILAHNMSVTERAGAMRERQLTLDEKDFEEKAANATAERALTAQITQYSKESTAMGNFGEMQKLVSGMVAGQSDPEVTSVAVARLLSMQTGMKIGADGKPLQPGDPVQFTEANLSAARQIVYPAAALNVLVTGSALDNAARGNGDNAARIVPPVEGETPDQYAARAAQRFEELSDRSVTNATRTIISGLKQTSAWQTRDEDGVRAYLNTNLYYPMRRNFADHFLKVREPQFAGLSPEDADAAKSRAVNDAYALADQFQDYIEKSAVTALYDQQAGANTAMRSEALNFGTSKSRNETKPVDSNETLPAIPAGALDTAF